MPSSSSDALLMEEAYNGVEQCNTAALCSSKKAGMKQRNDGLSINGN